MALIPQILTRESRPGLEEKVVAILQGAGYNCEIKHKDDNRKLVTLQDRDCGSVDLTICPDVLPRDVDLCHSVVYNGVTMRSRMERYKSNTDSSEVTSTTLTLKLLGEMTERKDPGFSIEALSIMAAIGRRQHSIYDYMTWMLDHWDILCFQRAKGETCNLCKYTEGNLHHDHTRKTFCTGSTQQTLNYANTYLLVSMKAADKANVFHLPDSNTTELKLAKFLPYMLLAEDRTGHQLLLQAYMSMINRYGLSATPTTLKQAIMSNGEQYRDDRLRIRTSATDEN